MNAQDRYVGGAVIMAGVFALLWFCVAAMYQTVQSALWVWRWLNS